MIYLNTLGRFTLDDSAVYLSFYSSIKALWKWTLCSLSSERNCCYQKFSWFKQEH